MNNKWWIALSFALTILGVSGVIWAMSLKHGKRSSSVAKTSPPVLPQALSGLEQDGNRGEAAVLSAAEKAPELVWNDDPAVFWSNRVVWLDREVMKAAADHGRAYPPMPYIDPEAMAIAPTPLGHHVESLDIVVPRLKGNNRERWFWDKFSRTHPHPPDYLDALFVSESVSCGDSLLTAKINGDPRWTGKTPGGLGRLRRDYPKMGIPIEMLDAESLAACCHLIKGDKPWNASSFRLSQQLATGTIPAVEEFLERGFEDASEVESELKTAYAWRTKYLRRLRREGTDESYIEAYKKAWNLSESDLREEEE